MSSIDIDLMSEEDFRRSIESRLRQGLAGKAADKLRTLIAPYVGSDRILPDRFLTVSAADLTINGWEALGDAMKRHDRPGRPVTAISIAFGWPGEEVPQPNAQGCLSPLVETAYYTDDAFPFSQSSHEDLLDGYSYHGCTWSGDCEATDNALWVSGIDDLHGALALLEAQLLASDEPDEDGIRAGSLGACLLSVLLFQAVSERVNRTGLPRPLCVMAGSSGVYPYFDAPVAGFPEDARKAAEAAEEAGTTVDTGIPGPRYSSLLVTGIRRAQKRAVLVLEETADEEAMRIAKLRGLAHGDAAAAPTDPLPDQPPPLRSDGSIASAPEPRQPDEIIAQSPASPLMVKKPSGQSWDFRDMLSSPGGEPPAGDPPPDNPFAGWDEEEPEAFVPAPDLPQPVEPDMEVDEPISFEPGPVEADETAAELDELWDQPLPEAGERPVTNPEPVSDDATLPEPEVEPEPESEPALDAWQAPEPELETETDSILEPEPEIEPVASGTPSRFPASIWGEDALRELGPGWQDDEPAELETLTVDPVPLELDPAWDEEALAAAQPEEETAESETAEAPVFADEAEAPLAKPGFSLFEELPAAGRGSLFTLPIFQKAVEAPEAQAPAPNSAVQDRPAPVWALGLAARDTVDAPQPDIALMPCPDEAPAAPSQPAKSLTTRLRDWWYGRS